MDNNYPNGYSTNGNGFGGRVHYETTHSHNHDTTIEGRRIGNTHPSDANQPGRGLINLGNTCYLNSAMQLLAACEPLRVAIVNAKIDQGIHWRPHKSDRATFQQDPLTLAAFGRESQGVFAAMKESRLQDAILPDNLVTLFAALHPDFDSEEQQDTGEFLLLMLDVLHSLTRAAQSPYTRDIQSQNLVSTALTCQQGWEKSIRKDSASFIKALFSYQIMSRTSCELCKAARRSEGGEIKVDPFSVLDVAIPPQSEDKTLSQLLLNQFGVQAVDDFRCEDCGQKGHVTKEYYLSRLPTYLIVQLSRFAGNQETSKILQFIDFPLRGLDLQPVVHPALRSSVTGLYDCIATIEHIGMTLESGHYKANVKCDVGDQAGGWIEYSDEILTRYAEEEIVNENVYVLLYKRQDTPPSTLMSTRYTKIHTESSASNRNSPDPSDTSQASAKISFSRLASLKEKATRARRKADIARRRPSTRATTQNQLDSLARLTINKYEATRRWSRKL